ncbi:MAG: TIGR01244 family sulfur transferase [Brevundimonas sp.]|jgi:uncharacterized protein (TIGR01244 family)|nr:TIGR01244 family sulfur transferase [Brevundimonas sp.]MCZ8321334.1 TIGR01244 family sulfur transferase [Novosphingobium sp.]
MFRRLTDTVLVSPQIALEDLAAAKAAGVSLVINNRPDGESDDQVTGAAIEAEARRLGLDYVAIPVTHAGFSAPQVEAMAAALDRASGGILAYCRSGTRSTLLWALARARAGDDLEQLTATAAAAGYDLSPVRPLMDMLKARAGD